MADGRELIEQVYGILEHLPGQIEAAASNYSQDERLELDECLESANKWVALCRRKIWLRGKEGTDMAQGCLDAANQLQTSLGRPAESIDVAADLAAQLETLARLLATKSQVMT